MPWYAYLAWKQLFPTGRSAGVQSVFYLLSALGVTIGVFLLVVSQSVMAGFGELWKEEISQTTGEVGVVSARPIEEPGRLVRELEQLPEVAAVAPLAMGIGLVRSADGVFSAFPKVIGIDPGRGAGVLPLEAFLVEGKAGDLDDNAIFLGSGLASRLGVGVGDWVSFHTPLFFKRLEEDEVLLPVELDVLGVFSTGWPEFDDRSAVLSLRRVQDLYDLGGAVHRVALRLEPGADPGAVADRINATLLGAPGGGREPPGGRVAVTWEELAGGRMVGLEFQRYLIFLMTVPINLVGGFVIVCAQLLAVISRRREIGLLAALGVPPGQLLGLYCAQGFAIGAVGAAGGIAAALTFLHFRDPLVAWAADLTGSAEVVREFYQFTSLPVSYAPADFALIAGSALVLATLASTVPALVAARKDPAEALRAE